MKFNNAIADKEEEMKSNDFLIGLHVCKIY